MSLLFYSEDEENKNQESIDKYKDLFEEYRNKSISLTEALNYMVSSSKIEKDKINVLTEDIVKKITEIIETNFDQIKKNIQI